MSNFISKPDYFHSGYNPIKVVVDSSRKNIPGFRYMVRLRNTDTGEVFSEFKIAPDPLNNGYGTIDISRIIQNYLEGFLDITSSTPEDSKTSYFKYDIDLGESYVNGWYFDDYIFLSGGALGLTTDSTYGSGFSDAPHTFTEGDQIKVQLDNTYPDNDSRNLLNDYWTVLKVIDTKTIKIGNNFGIIGNNPATPGRAVDAEEKRTIVWNNDYETFVAVNTAMNVVEYSNTMGGLGDYDLSDTNNHPNVKILTNQPKVYTITPNQYVYFNFLNPDVGLVGNHVIKITPSSGGGGTKTINLNNHIINTVGVGLQNFLLSGLYTHQDINNMNYYNLVVVDSLGDPISEEYKFFVDRRCKMNETQILFMDRKGSYNSFSFQLRNRENVSINRESYNKYVDDFSTFSRGTRVYHSEASKSLDLVTNFMSEAMNLYFEELVSSRNTYINWRGVWYACVVTDTSVENEFERNNKLINKSIRVNLSLNNPIN